MEFTFTELSLKGLILIKHETAGDARGFFAEIFRENCFREGGVPTRYVQESHSRSRRGVLRGLHYQVEPCTQGKLIRCAHGEIFDAAVDLRIGSPTFGKGEGQILSDTNKKMLYIPPGFAHGFCVLSDVADMIYRQTAYYSPGHEGGIRWDDPAIGIAWPIEPTSVLPRDAAFPFLKDAGINFKFNGDSE